MEKPPSAQTMKNVRDRLTSFLSHRDEQEEKLRALSQFHLTTFEAIKRLEREVESLARSLPNGIAIALGDDLETTIGWCRSIHALLALLLATSDDTPVKALGLRVFVQYEEMGFYRELFEQLLSESALAALEGKKGTAP